MANPRPPLMVCINRQRKFLKVICLIIRQQTSSALWVFSTVRFSCFWNLRHYKLLRKEMTKLRPFQCNHLGCFLRNRAFVNIFLTSTTQQYIDAWCSSLGAGVEWFFFSSLGVRGMLGPKHKILLKALALKQGVMHSKYSSVTCDSCRLLYHCST